MQAEAWAVVEHGTINVRSVSPSRRAAIVNWLCTERGLMATPVPDDLTIERTWKYWRARGATVTQVAVVAVACPVAADTEQDTGGERG